MRCASGSRPCSANAPNWILTFHSACGRILRREAQRLGYRSNFTIYDQADQIRLTKQVLEELDKDPKRFVPRGIHKQISTAKNNLVGPGGLQGARRVLLRPDRRRRVRALPAAPDPVERGRLRRHALPHGQGARELPGGARALAEGLPLHPGRRVPGHEPRAVPAPPAPGRKAQERLRRRRSGPVRGRGDTRHDGRWLDEAHRDDPGRGRGAVVLRKRGLPRGEGHKSAPIHEKDRNSDLDGERAAGRLHAGAHALRGVQSGEDASALHDVPHVETRVWFSHRNFTDLHARPTALASWPSDADERRARGRHVGRGDLRQRSRSPNRRNALVPALPASYFAVHRPADSGTRGQERGWRPEASRPRL